jgi:hypothetical protein
MTPLTASVALLLAAALSQSAPTPSSPTTTFHSDILRLDYTYGSTFAAMPTATDSSNGFRMIIIMRMDGVCLGHLPSTSELGSLTTSALTQSLKRFGDPQMGTSADYQVTGHPASVISGSVKSEQYGQTFYGTSSCLIQGADAVCWEFMASDCSKLPALMANPVQFNGQLAAALIPERFAQTCKP